MKTPHYWLLLAAAISGICSTASAQPEPPRSDTFFVANNKHDFPSEPTTFLGVETGRVSPTLTEQLGLARGVGLVVNAVVPDSPAITVLKPHDILTKLNDQILIETRQLGVLVRSFKEGDEVTLKFIRGGKETTAKVKLSKRDLPPLTSGSEFRDSHFEIPLPPGFAREEADRMLSIIGPEAGAGPDHRRVFPIPPGGPRSTSVDLSNTKMLFTDSQGSLELTHKDGKRSLVAKTTKGETLFSGPIDTPEERKTLPSEIQERLEKLENMQGFRFRTDGGFEGGVIRSIDSEPRLFNVPVPPPLENRNSI